ncbi:MAG: FprA family A-type flavoprotein [Candidatus Woesearchaeota archaeon]
MVIKSSKEKMHEEISQGIYRFVVPGNKFLFEGFWPVRDGVTMNSYLVKGEKTALIDGVWGVSDTPEKFAQMLKKTGTDAKNIDYVVLNHLEPDHTGWLSYLSSINPKILIYASEKGVEIAKSLYNLKNIKAVKTGDILDLGRSKVLEFTEIPNVHWPETMMTFEKDSKILFCCDLFGGFGYKKGYYYDDQVSEFDDFYYDEYLRYYSNIIGMVSVASKQATMKVKDIPYKMIAPGHGLIWKKEPKFIVNLYEKFANWQKNPEKKKITVVAGSMYGNSMKARDFVLKILDKKGVDYELFFVPENPFGVQKKKKHVPGYQNVSDILRSAWESKGMIISAPTYEYKLFPPMAAVLEELARKRIGNRKVLRIGSYGWSGGAQRDIEKILSDNSVSWEMDVCEFKGAADKKSLSEISSKTESLLKSL